MNTAITASKRIYRSETNHTETAIQHGTIWKIIFPCIIVMVAGLGYIWLQSSTERLQREVSRLEAQNESQLQRLSNLRIEMESNTSRRKILQRATQFELGLRPPMVGQTRRISLNRNPVRNTSQRRGDSLLAQSRDW